jgi:uncharacterized protein (TIGR02301 family)
MHGTMTGLLKHIIPHQPARRLRALVSVMLFAVMMPTGPSSAAFMDETYARDLLHLSGVMGALHYLERLCYGVSPWREQMTDLLSAQEPSRQWQMLMVRSFNRSYDRYKLSYRNCTSETRTLTRQQLREGEKLMLRLEQDAAVKSHGN